MTQKYRLDQEMARRGLVFTRSQAESYIKLRQVEVNNTVVIKPGQQVAPSDKIVVQTLQQYVSRAALKLASVSDALGIDFRGRTVLDVGSSTGGFTDYVLRHGAVKSIAVDVGTDQLHPSLRANPCIELHEKTDIRNFTTDQNIDIVVADVSFISLREILPHVASLCTVQTQIVVMVKPQFEAAVSNLKHKGVIKNDTIRRQILRDFETWAEKKFRIVRKADSDVSGAKGNVERFYLLMVIAHTLG